MSDARLPAQPLPASVPAEDTPVPAKPVVDGALPQRPALDPTRYGDWEKNGRCIDF